MIVIPGRAGGWAIAVLAAVAVAGCSPSQQPREDADALTTSAAPTTTTSPTPEPTLSSAEREALDRAAAEQAWVGYWDTYGSLVRDYPTIPSSEWRTTIDPYAVEPVVGEVVQHLTDISTQGLVGYGTVANHPYWDDDIAGSETATLWDCQDDSRAGLKDARTGDKRTAGHEQNLIRATLVRGADEEWRVQQYEYYVDRSC